MAIDPYALCPCGSGKKLKFCCSDVVGDIEKIHRMIEGDQPRAALRHVEQTLASHPDRASLLDLKASLELSLDELDAARKTVERFVAKHADSPTALACQALLLAETEQPRPAIASLQKALPLVEREMPQRLFEAIGAVGSATRRQYELARDAIWRGAQRRNSLERFKSVYSIFISRVDAYTEKHVPELSPAAQGQVGIVGAKRMWLANQQFWKSRPTPLRQEIVFASTGTKKPDDPPWKYVVALAGSDIQTNPPATNAAVETSGLVFRRTVDQLPAPEVLTEIDSNVDMRAMEDVLMREGVVKFADPQKALHKLLAERRRPRLT